MVTIAAVGHSTIGWIVILPALLVLGLIRWLFGEPTVDEDDMDWLE